MHFFSPCLCAVSALPGHHRPSLTTASQFWPWPLAAVPCELLLASWVPFPDTHRETFPAPRQPVFWSPLTFAYQSPSRRQELGSAISGPQGPGVLCWRVRNQPKGWLPVAGPATLGSHLMAWGGGPWGRRGTVDGEVSDPFSCRSEVDIIYVLGVPSASVAFPHRLLYFPLRSHSLK